ncbi:MAG: group 1 truncated hemoglobin [Microcella sp.]|nr:group 1 truncated hemoglobin [Microcella sp.]
MSIYDALGGGKGIRAFVDDLSVRLSADDELGPLFEGVDAQALQRHRLTYLTAVLGGPEQYGGQSMRDAHRALHLTDRHMDRFVTLMSASLAAVGVADETSRAVVQLIDRLRPVIVEPAVHEPMGDRDATRPASAS